jgi:hypothetical protein
VSKSVKTPGLDDYLSELSLDSLSGIEARRSREVDALIAQIRRDAHPDRGGRMLIGLVMAFVSIAEQVLAIRDEDSLEDALEHVERLSVYETGRNQGRKVNSLIIEVEDEKGAPRQVGIRGPYDGFLNVIRGDLRRFDYPSSAPHATQAWSAHIEELETVFAMSSGERRATAELLWQLVLELPEHRRRTQPRKGVQPFVTVLEDFHSSRGKGEPTGALLQGLAYGFIRADAPTLDISTARVRSGRRRGGGVGDIDGFDGPDIALAAEVKDFEITRASDLAGFMANLGDWPDAVAFVVCKGATADVIQLAESNNVTVVTRKQMIDASRLWTIDKQLMAVRSAFGYFVHYEQNDALIQRFSTFLKDREIDLR